MDQKLSQQVNQPPEVANGWPRTSLLPGEDCLVATQSASSALTPADSDDGGELPSNSSLQSTTSLKERDYIGLAEVTSAPSADEIQNETGLKLQEPDLRLGLGLPNFDSVERVSDFKEVLCIATPQATGVVHVGDYVRTPSPSIQKGTPLKTLLETIETAQGKTPSSLAQAVSKNSMKRLHADAIADTHREIALTKNLNTVSVRFNTLDSRSSASSLLSKAQSREVEIKSFSQGARRSTPFISWPFQNDALVNPYSAKPRMNSVPLPCAPTKIEGDGEELRNLSLDLKFCSDGAKVQSCRSERDACDEAPPAKGQVVGWPPVRSYRRSAFATCSKPPGKEGGSHSAMFVKVNMDGIPVGRKVDLSVYKSYDNLLSALEEMFRTSKSGSGAQFSKGADFVLTYEDRDGDWMLVGDVPWDLFVTAVRRLRITRGSEMAGLGLQSSTCQV